MPYLAIVIGPGIGRVAVADTVEKRWLVEFLGRPFVKLLQPWRDEAVVQHLTDFALCCDVRRDLVPEGISVGKDSRKG
jgi:hypothetical protein